MGRSKKPMPSRSVRGGPLTCFAGSSHCKPMLRKKRVPPEARKKQLVQGLALVCGTLLRSYMRQGSEPILQPIPSRYLEPILMPHPISCPVALSFVLVSSHQLLEFLLMTALAFPSRIKSMHRCLPAFRGHVNDLQCTQRLVAPKAL